ncbi:MAG: DEAD/DEAH box helicase, partial [Candidatus Heimdallarchaeota archaeon]
MIENRVSEEGLSNFQIKCLKAYRSMKDVLVIAPSSAGKTFITEKFVLEYFHSIYGKFLLAPRRYKIGFVLPYKSLAIQEFNNFSLLVEQSGIKIMLAVGGVEIREEEIAEANIIVGTYEKFLTLIKRHPVLKKYLKILVIDEFHFLGTDRGTTLEEIILEWKRSERKAQLILLSSSIANPLEIADWINVLPIIENHRPVPLTYSLEISNDIINFISNIQEEKKQILIFSQSRSEAEIVAEKLASKKNVKNNYDLDQIFNSTVKTVEDQSIIRTLKEAYFPDLLKEVIRKGVAYHHAGLSDIIRLLVEEMFLRGEVDFLVSTSTLAAGVNLPADVSVYTLKHNRITTENNLVFQTLGRAGRLGYKHKGEGIVLVPNERMRKRTENRYFNQKDDKSYVPVYHAVESKFGNYDFFTKYYLDCMYHSKEPFSSELVHLINYLEDSLWFYQKRTKIMRDLADHNLLNALFSSTNSNLETHEVIDFYRRFDRTRGITEKKLSIQSIEGINQAAVVANIREQSKLQQIYLSPSRRSCTCQNKHSNFICKHQRFLLDQYPEAQERWLNNYGIIDFLTKEGFIVKSAGERINLTYMGLINARYFIHPYDFLDYLEYCSTNQEITITQYLKQFITRDKRIKQEIKANELSSLQAIKLAQDIVNGRDVKEMCTRYNVSDSFINDWR